MLKAPFARLLAIALAAVLAACGQSQQAAAPPDPVVTVARPAQKAVVDLDEYVGRFVAVDSVEVRARVSGYLDAIHFQDGQIVRKGDPLFTIDRRPFETALAQARASLDQAKANLAFAEADLQRALSVAVGTVITQQTLDQRNQAKRVAQANVAAQEQAVRQAALDVEFTELRAPVEGRIGDRRVAVGNIVTGGTSGTTLLATIESVDPIRFEFTLDEGSYVRYSRLAKHAADSADLGLTLPVRL
jgi:RND family efflux transporter MFP subunit